MDFAEDGGHILLFCESTEYFVKLNIFTAIKLPVVAQCLCGHLQHEPFFKTFNKAETKNGIVCHCARMLQNWLVLADEFCNWWPC